MLTTNGFDHRPSNFVVFDATIYAQKLKEAEESKNPDSFPVLSVYFNAARQFVAGTGTIPATQLSEIYENSDKTPQGIVEEDMRAYLTYGDAKRLNIEDAESAAAAIKILMAESRLHYIDPPVEKKEKEIKSHDNISKGGLTGRLRPATPDGRPIPIKRAPTSDAKKPKSKIKNPPPMSLLDGDTKDQLTTRSIHHVAHGAFLFSDQELLKSETDAAKTELGREEPSKLGVYQNNAGKIVVAAPVDAKAVSSIASNPGFIVRGKAAGAFYGYLTYRALRLFGATDQAGVEEVAKLLHAEKELVKGDPAEIIFKAKPPRPKIETPTDAGPTTERLLSKPHAPWVKTYVKKLAGGHEDDIKSYVYSLAAYAGRYDRFTDGNSNDDGHGTLDVYVDNDINGVHFLKICNKFCESKVENITACGLAIKYDLIPAEEIKAAAFQSNKLTIDMVHEKVKSQFPDFGLQA